MKCPLQVQPPPRRRNSRFRDTKAVTMPVCGSMPKLLVPLAVALLPLAAGFSASALPRAAAWHATRTSTTPLSGRAHLRPATIRPSSLGLSMERQSSAPVKDFVAAQLTIEDLWDMSVGKWKGLRSSHNIAFSQLGKFSAPGPGARKVQSPAFS